MIFFSFYFLEIGCRIKRLRDWLTGMEEKVDGVGVGSAKDSRDQLEQKLALHSVRSAVFPRVLGSRNLAKFSLLMKAGSRSFFL
jgi:hypothetical protein